MLPATGYSRQTTLIGHTQLYSPTMLAVLDGLFLAFHTALTAFNLCGWLWRKTRRIHLFSIGLTFASWIGLGFVYGFGYCPLTDWHWQIKYARGEENLPASYVKYYVDRVTGLDSDPAIVDGVVLALALTALILSVWLNVRDRRVRRLG
jgi:hypothetical protein